MSKAEYSERIADLIDNASEELSVKDFDELVDWIGIVLGDYV